MLSDFLQRQQAIDPDRSFIVQAPAGSGKTEILTQRYLKLLAKVEAPEQIIALTFTRKAANEMRERILLTLQHVARGSEPLSTHQAQTYKFATAALEQDKRLHWQLLQQPGRLRIFTIDALCQRLTHALPFQEKHFAYGQLSDKPQRYYFDAARSCLAYTIEEPQFHSYLKVLLQHVDNRQEKLIELFAQLLAKREQWLFPLHQAKLQNQAHVEEALSWIEEHELTRFYETIPPDCIHALHSLSRQLSHIEGNPACARASLQKWDSPEAMDRNIAAGLSALLLTSTNTLRKSFDHHVGLKRGACDNSQYEELKSASKSLLARLSESSEFLKALLRVKSLPYPRYESGQWEVLQALFALLPLLAAHLQLKFSEENAVDFTSVSQQALMALGSEDNPTDLALYLDYHIHHLLIDEFQDTSIQQFDLLSRLTQGWQTDDGKTMFVVGDPMQSIYRFRSAEVGLFLRAKQTGIGAVQLIPLQLSCNFRSNPILVKWVNQQFKLIFPHQDDMESGAVSFNPSSPTREETGSSFIEAKQCAHRLHEAESILQSVQKELRLHPEENIAILVRSRKQLTDIIALLRRNQIPFQGVEIDLLTQLPHLRDVWSLTQALLMPANRLAWLAFLRSPWCGIKLSDLHSLAQYNKQQSVYFALTQHEQVPGISDEGKIRISFIYHVLHQALACRHQHSLVNWIGETLKQLHWEKVLSTSEQEDLEQFWLLLDQFSKDGQIKEMEQFTEELNRLYSQQSSSSRLQVMTIHKSKGLEFDCVILPGLSTKSSAHDSPLMRWLKLPRQEENLLLFSPIKAVDQDFCALYDYLGKLDAEKNDYDLQRLLYVAVTRAKKRLYLFDNQEQGNKGSLRSLLSQQEFKIIEQEETTRANEDEFPKLFHLPLEHYLTPPKLLSQSAMEVFKLSNNHSRQIGIVAHELLQWICNHHAAAFAEVPFELAHYRFREMGFTNDTLELAQKTLGAQISQLFTSPKGQWLIGTHHEEKNEYELLIEYDNKVQTRIIDRTFCEHGIRWIIDFKTGKDLETTQLHHKEQVNEYARLLSYDCSEPIRCGLYYLENSNWIEWDYIDQFINEGEYSQ